MAKITHKCKSVSRLITPVAFAIALAACTTTSTKAPRGADITSSPTESSAAYILKADNSQGVTQSDWLILALKSAVAADDQRQAELLIGRLVTQSLTHSQIAEWQLARAELRRNQSDYLSALQRLDFQPFWQLEAAQWQRYYELRHELHLFTADYLEASRDLIELARYTKSEERTSELWASVWQHVSALNLVETDSLPIKNDEVILSGWLSLSQQLNTLKDRPMLLQSSLKRWFSEHPTHPANVYPPQQIQDILALEIIQPENVALLLPLTGRFGPQGIRVRDGFINAMFDDSKRDAIVHFKVIDTNEVKMDDIVVQLEADKTQFVVGPLIKSEIIEFQDLNRGIIAQLALNIPDEINPANNSCYFTLSPEQEVEQAAEHLFEKGHKHPLFLAPKGKYGDRLAQAFTDKWQQLTSEQPDVHFFGKRSELQRQVNEVFGLSASERRIKQMAQLLNMDIKHEARSRRDIDAVYMVATSAELTLLKPFIEVAINPGVAAPKLYASSRSNNGTQQQLSELQGVEFSDIPFLVDGDTAFKAKFEKIWPKSNKTETRLHALGMDAYQLISELPQMKVIEGYSAEGKTGTLSIDSQCVIQRQISWNQHGVTD
ncbi:penicillin-binding protein activator [Aliivibrio kagoshimensis]|uniref:penicillin-binding protein activator n=1 Tax=Aliivibrio kagoshimensis TaxID=2910230 RepID=UPI003D13F9AD